MAKLITVAIPVYKRLNYLPGVLECVRAQHHPAIELIVSDNGLNGSRVPPIVEQHYGRAYRFRQNAAEVSLGEHFNQIVGEASGEYFAWLADDDEISPNFVSTLAAILDANPDVAVAFAREEAIDEQGQRFDGSNERVPPVVECEEFVRAWCSYELRCRYFATYLARTADVRRCGGFPDFPHGNHSDNALVLKLSLNRRVAFSQDAVFRCRVYETSGGLGADYNSLAEASRRFLAFLDSDPTVQEYARRRPDQWPSLRASLRRMTWETYLSRWKNVYRRRLTSRDWIKAGFAMPFIAEYYTRLVGALGAAAKEAAIGGKPENVPH